jgi:hypothetical protein
MKYCENCGKKLPKELESVGQCYRCLDKWDDTYMSSQDIPREVKDVYDKYQDKEYE